MKGRTARQLLAIITVGILFYRPAVALALWSTPFPARPFIKAKYRLIASRNICLITNNSFPRQAVREK